MQKILKLFLSWRVFLLLPVIVGSLFLVPRTGYLSSNPWANFDGVHYLSIAQNGYISEAAFFPLYPLVIKALAFILGGNFFAAAFIISNLAFILSLYFLQKLFEIDLPYRKSLEAITLLLFFPVSFYFGAVYSESLFLLLLVLSFYFARKDRWFLAGLMAFFLCTTRLVGIFIVPALLFEYYRQYKSINLKLLLPSLSLAAYSLFNHFRWGDALYFVHAHSELGNSRSVDNIILFPQTLYRYFKILISLCPSQFEWQIALLEVISFLFALYLFYLAWRHRVRSSYLVFSLLAFLLPASSGTFSGLPRYLIILFPLYLSLTYLPKPAKYIFICLSPLLLFILTMYFSQGYFIA